MFRLDVVVCIRDSVLSGDVCDRIQLFLQRRLSHWCEKLRIWHWRGRETLLVVAAPGNLADGLRSSITDHGPRFYELQRRFGPSPSPRICGGIELRGANASVGVFVDADEARFAPTGDQWNWGNSLSIQVCRARVEGLDAAVWSRAALSDLCTALDVPYAHAQMMAEFEEKNTFHSEGHYRALCGCCAVCLPGLFWLNYIGPPYAELIGRERLLSAPAWRAECVGEGILIEVAPDPRQWDSSGYQDVERRVLEHLGRQYFFSRERPAQQVATPDFGLPRPPFPGKVLCVNHETGEAWMDDESSPEKST